jgi:hypothetical protein
MQVQQGAEPPTFTVHFHSWDPTATPRSASDYEARIAQLRSEAGLPAAEEQPSWTKPEANGAAPATNGAAAAAAEADRTGSPAGVAVNVPGTDADATSGTERAATKDAKNGSQAKDASAPKFEVRTDVGKAGKFTALTDIGGGEFKPSVEDPSGTKGTTTARKYVVGQVSPSAAAQTAAARAGSALPRRFARLLLAHCACLCPPMPCNQ